jgi:hypothetical protein
VRRGRWYKTRSLGRKKSENKRDKRKETETTTGRIKGKKGKIGEGERQNE